METYQTNEKRDISSIFLDEKRMEYDMVLEHIAEMQIRSLKSIGDMQFVFMPKRGTTDAIFIVRDFQEYFSQKKIFITWTFWCGKGFRQVFPSSVLVGYEKTGVDE